jgi:antitoxin (DNA-binding transcriptional repressor) of toxin-antitoxin stability system
LGGCDVHLFDRSGKRPPFALVDEALEGKQVIITPHGKPVVELRPAATAGRPVTMKDIEWLRKCRESLPSVDGDTVAEIRAMRDDF